MSVRKTILFIDDEPNVLKSFKRALRNEPYSILSAHSASEAIEILQNNSVQVVITDFRMPGMNGVEFLREVHELDKKIVCAVLSGFADEQTIKTALDLKEIRKFLVKPIDNEELKKEINLLFDQYGKA